MSKVTAICQMCGKQFEYDLKPGFPRKYCPECGAKRKAEYENRQSEVSVPVVKIGEVAKKEEVKKEVAEDVVIRKDKPNSYEFGKAGSRFKVYFNTAGELKNLVKELLEVQDEMFPLE